MKKALSLIKKLAPTVATALVGPFGGLAVATLAKALGKEDASVDELDELIVTSAGNPSVLTAIRQSDNDFKVRMKELGIREDDLHARDRQSAREMYTRTRDVMVPIIATVYVVGFFGMLSALIFIAVPEQAISPMNILLGALAQGLAQILAFYFGSSKGSETKTALLANGRGG